MKVSSSQSLVKDALKALNSGNHKTALRCFTTLEQLEPENGEWSLQAGLMYHRLGKRKHAIAALERAGQRCHVQGQLERAVAIYQQILRLDPVNHVAIRGLSAQRFHHPASSASHTVGRRAITEPPAIAAGTQSHEEVDGFGVPRSKAARVALALSFLEG